MLLILTCHILTQLLSLRNPGDFVWWALFIIAALKAVTAAITRKGGGSAGTFMPALVIGGWAINASPLPQAWHGMLSYYL